MDFVKNDFNGFNSFDSAAWSYLHPICAVIVADGSVHFFNDRGEEFVSEKLSRNTKALVISWSPCTDTLAIGWKDGCVSIFSNGEHIEIDEAHKSPVTKLCWHPALPYLFSADESNSMICWDCEEDPCEIFLAKAEEKIDNVIFSHTGSPQVYISCGKTIYKVEESDEEEDSALEKISESESEFTQLQFSATTQRLIAITKNNELEMYDTLHGYKKFSQVKLQPGIDVFFTDVRADLITYSVVNVIIVWSPSNDRMMLLRAPFDEAYTSIFFDTNTSILFATTDSGKIVMFKNTMKGPLKREGWSNPIIVDTQTKIEQAQWSHAFPGFIALAKNRKPSIIRYFELFALNELTCLSKCNMIKTRNDILKVGGAIYRLSESQNIVLASSSDVANLFQKKGGNLSPMGTIKTGTDLAIIMGENIFVAEDTNIKRLNLSGTLVQTNSLGSNSPIQFLEKSEQFLVAICQDRTVFVVDAGRRQTKTLYTTTFSAPYQDYRIRSVALSASGFCVSIILDIFNNGSWRPSPYIFLHSPQFDKTVNVDFGLSVPVLALWDTEDPRLLCVQVTPYRSTLESNGDAVVVPLFVGDSLFTFKQPTLKVPPSGRLSVVNIPRVLFNMDGLLPCMCILPQFAGIDTADEGTRKSLMELNFALASGDIDAALNAARNVQSDGTWRMLCQTCIQNDRTELLPMCLGKIGNAAFAIHVSKALKENDIVLAKFLTCVAIGANDNAKKIAVENKRYELVAQLSISVGEYDDALSLTRKRDRMHVKQIQYQRGRIFEIQGNLKEAARSWEEAGVIETEFPRAAMQADNLKFLFEYVETRSLSEVPKGLLLWLGRFFEAHNVDKSAIKMYESANSVTDMVRLLSLLGRFDDCRKVLQKSKHPASYCMFARILMKRISYLKDQNDQSGEINKLQKEVIDLFRRARQYSQAMDFALSQKLFDEVLSLSFSCPQTTLIKAAQTFEELRMDKQAVILYARAGRMNRALALCFTKNLYDALDEISDSLTIKTPPDILVTCGKHFIESDRWSKAAECFALAKQFDIVEKIMKDHNVKISKQTIQSIAETEQDPEILRQFAAMCERQNENSIAASLYVKLKDLLSAVKCLARAGDTQKVVKFAKTARNREVYILAANYLQTLDAYGSETIFDLIVAFLTKSGALDKLARFYDSIARQCAEEHQEYERAFELLKKSVETMINAPESDKREAMLNVFRERTRTMAMYIESTKIVEENPQQALAICATLLKTPNIEQLLKLDDIYIVMIEAFVAKGSMKNAYKLLDDMVQSGTDVLFYLDLSEIQAIYKAVGQTYTPPKREEEEDDFDDVEDLTDEDVV
ncbi:hypothetical protein TVAG_003730 [Trichomonas vaginalis G3]|uniref:Uncharacterized protein n=1 Tax=Trichomonas vaginalis (strain ATCC PRA-98 / G3) TaxID=412133 RepID=A2E587_TRIV3|nr:ift140/172-related cilium protein family [Trichomonas vaginalis G3]EAY12167.1 hypothetical protein TVAG_003730 [Trichomonas vaginalis G3]KAI5515388.1 ift140/172-related cilium protein family [Trichomonas vaginalis G3]|eukprot:XP_001324390.1 hypothetical protein [Trichomonas vaginalis G3]